MTDDGSIGRDLVRWGRAVRLETTVARTGRTATASRLLPRGGRRSRSLWPRAAPDAAWARNLVADPSATATVGDRTFAVVAEPLGGDDFATAIRELILKGGTPAERLGHGPAFRLRRLVHDK